MHLLSFYCPCVRGILSDLYPNNRRVGVIAFMLLSSSLPFYGKERISVVHKILKNNYKFKGRRWEKVSSQAKTFIKDILVSNPDKRVDAESALGFAWLNQRSTAATTEEEDMARSSMMRYADYPKLKKIVRKRRNNHAMHELSL
jgi:calcium-dependent protein kinase